MLLEASRNGVHVHTFLGHDIPDMVYGCINADNFGPALLHLKSQETARGSDLEHSLTIKRDPAEVVVHATAQVPLPRDGANTGKIH